MGNLIIKIQGPVASWGRSTDSPRAAAVTYPYNRSSTAPAIHDIPSPELHTGPQPIPLRDRTLVTARSNSMFLGLDQRIRSRSRTSTVVSVVVHIVVITLVLWVAMAIHSPVVDSSLSTVAPVPFTLYDPAPTARDAGGQSARRRRRRRRASHHSSNSGISAEDRRKNSGHSPGSEEN